MVNDELKPCPFCGGRHIECNNDTGPNDDYFVEWIECMDCGAKANDEAAWNRRTPEQPE